MGFTAVDLLVILAVLSLLAAVIVPLVAQSRAKTRLAQCLENMRQINRAILQYADEHRHKLPSMDGAPAPGGWWSYREQVKGYLGLTEPASPKDKVFACPDDRGYDEGVAEPRPFCLSRKHSYTSYVFNGVILPGIPNIADREVSSIKDPSQTLLVMEWTAHAPLSWHRSLTGKGNSPFYNDAESVVGFVDGRADFIKIYYDGLNAAYTRDPVPGYGYKYSGD